MIMRLKVLIALGAVLALSLVGSSALCGEARRIHLCRRPDSRRYVREL